MKAIFAQLHRFAVVPPESLAVGMLPEWLCRASEINTCEFAARDPSRVSSVVLVTATGGVMSTINPSDVISLDKPT